MTVRAALAAVAALVGVAGCTVVPKSTPPRLPTPAPVPAPAPAPGAAAPAGPAVPVTAAQLQLTPGPAVSALGIDAEKARTVLQAFRLSCPVLQRRKDGSGLTRPEDWTEACTAAASWSDADPLPFFETRFEAVQVGDGRTLATGYYEPEILGSRAPAPGYAVPVYRRPADLVDVELGLFSESLAGKKVRGRVEGTQLVPYPDRAAIEGGALSGRGLEIAWAADPVEFFFLQIQGSGRLRLPDGSVMRIGYDGQNGRDYVGIGGLLRDRGVLAPGQASMQGIMGYLRAQPDGGRSVMNENRSFVFFRELTGPGPVGALNVPVSPLATVAADPAFVPLGAPVFLRVDRAEANGLWVAQDTGGAIKGANRFDTFWGAGESARTIAGGMSARGQALLLLPRGTLARLSGGEGGRTQP